MSNELSRFLASSATPATLATYTAINNQVVHNTTIHVHMAPARDDGNNNNKRRKQNAPTIEVDPYSYGAVLLSEAVCAVLDPNRSALTSEVKLKFYYPYNIDRTASNYHHAITLAEADSTNATSSVPANYGRAILDAAMAAKDHLSDGHKAILSNLRVLTSSDPDPNQGFISLIWQFYTRNPIAIAAFMSPTDNRAEAAKNYKPFMLPCPLCNPCCAALRDRLNTAEIFVPKTPIRRAKDERPTVHDNAVTKYLTIPNLLTHCQTITDSNTKHESFIVLHRLLSHFYTILDTGVKPDYQPLYSAVEADYAELPNPDDEIVEAEQTATAAD